MPAPVLAAPLVIPFAEAIGVSIAALGMAKATDKVNEFIQENPEQSMKIFQMIMPSQGIANALKNKSSEGDEEVSEDIDVEVEEKPKKLTGREKGMRIKEAIRRARAGRGNYSSPDAEGSAVDIRGSVIREVEDMGIADKDLKDNYDPTKPKFDYKKFFKKRYADGGSIGIEVLFEEKKPRKDFNIGGQAQKTNTTPYDARASVQDYAAAMQKVGAGTDAQKLQAIGEYGLNQMQNSPSYFKAVGQGINQHMLNNQMLRDAVDARRITEDQYKLMGDYDVARLSPKIGLGNIKIGGTPGDVGIASAIYNAIKAGGIGAEKLGIKETDPYNQYGDIGFFGSIAKNYQGAKGLLESDKTLYEDIISGKTQSDIDRFRSGLYAANQFDKATGDRLFGGKIEKMFNEYKQSPSTFFYAGDDTQNMYDRFNKYYADGGRVGLFMGGSPLTGQALSIYNSMNAYGFDDQAIADALAAQGLYTPGSSTPVVEEPVTNIAPNIINQGGGGDGPASGPTFNRNDLLGTPDYFPAEPFSFKDTISDIGDYIKGGGIIGAGIRGIKNLFSRNTKNYVTTPQIKARDRVEAERIAREEAARQEVERQAAYAQARQDRETYRDLEKSITSGQGGQGFDRPSSGPTATGAGMGVGGGYASDYGFKNGGLAAMFKNKR